VFPIIDDRFVIVKLEEDLARIRKQNPEHTAHMASRTGDCLVYRSNQPAFLLVDVDFKGLDQDWVQRLRDPLTLWHVLECICPGLQGAGYVIRRSTSAGLRNKATGEEFPGSGGLHIYVMIQDGADSQRALKALAVKCWLHGFGWGWVGKNGTIHERCLVDIHCGTPEHPAYEASPVLVGDDLEQDAAAREPIWREGRVVDSRAAIPDPTPEEMATYREIVAATKAAMADEANEIARVYNLGRAQEMSARTGRSVEECLEDAERLVKGELTADVLLDFDDPDLGEVTVGDVLENPARYASATMVDPVYGCDYFYRRNQAKFIWPSDGTKKPYISAFAHGRGMYQLVTEHSDWSKAAVRRRRSLLHPIEAPPPLMFDTVGGGGSVHDDDDEDDGYEDEGYEDEGYEDEDGDVDEGPVIDGTAEVVPPAPTPPPAVQQPISPAQPDTQPLTLSTGTPFISAQWMVNRCYSFMNMPTLLRLQGTFYRWNGRHHVEVTDEVIRAAAYAFLDKAVRPGGRNAPPQPFHPDRESVSNLMDALKAVTLNENEGNPAWLDGTVSPLAREFLPCANGLLHVLTRRLVPATPAYFGTYCLPYGYDASAAEPVLWKNFLNQIFPGDQKSGKPDQESIDTLQEIFGLALTTDTSFQKMFMLIGARRSGKGTIIRVLTALLGSVNVAGPTIESLSDRFGMETLIGKPLAVVSDARIGAKIDTSIAVERILSITGEDSLSVGRKHKIAWTGKLPTRFIILSNLLPELSDPSGALSSRCIILKFAVSFLGKEDRTLTGRLMAELPGILKWALDGLDRLYKRGYLIQPKSADDSVEALKELTSPIEAFVNDRCTVTPDAQVAKSDLFSAWKMWCYENDMKSAGSANRFGAKIRGAVPSMGETRPDGKEIRQRLYTGIKLNPAAPPASSQPPAATPPPALKQATTLLTAIPDECHVNERLPVPGGRV
jgi:putative DNA primase/helicase